MSRKRRAAERLAQLAKRGGTMASCYTGTSPDVTADATDDATADAWQAAEWWEDPVHEAFVRAMNARARVYDGQGLVGRARQLRHILRVQVGAYVGPAVRVEEHAWAYTPCLQGTGELPGDARCIHVSEGLDDLVYPGGVCVPADDHTETFCHAQTPCDPLCCDDTFD